METSQRTPPGPAKFGGPLWRELFKHICSEANRLGLQVNMNNDAGWCGSGGPWITPELSMQRVVSVETNVTGPWSFDAVLPEPKAIANFHRDIALFAFPTPSRDYLILHIKGKSAETKEEIPLQTHFPALSEDAIIPRERIVNLTGKLSQDGRLTWEVPEGKWTLLRVGHTSTGKDNHPAPADGRGLESDKLSKHATEVHFAGLMEKLIGDSKPLAGENKTLVSTHIDSWETGSQNWTPNFREEFTRLRGYDPMPLLPVLSGRVVDSLEISERFLWDVRMTVNDLLTENYAGHLRELAHRHGRRLSIEAYDGSPTDDLTYAGRADEPMGEFWSWSKFGAAYSCTEMTSAAHVYGKPIVGAEAFTATDAEKCQGHPANLKDLGDWAFCEGINRFVFHRYALQPWTGPARAPGISMGPWGLHYERTQTWWEQSRAWHGYLARCQFLLQQGLFVADLCFLAPERSPQQFKSPVKSSYDRPGYNFDGCPPEVVSNENESEGRPDRSARRDELSNARAAASRNDVAAPASQDQRPCRERRNSCGRATAQIPKPQRLSEVRQRGAGARVRIMGQWRSAFGTKRAFLWQRPNLLGRRISPTGKTSVRNGASAGQGEMDLAKGRKSGDLRASRKTLFPPRDNAGHLKPCIGSPDYHRG